MRNRCDRRIDFAGKNVDRLQISLVALLHVRHPLRVFLICEELTSSEFRRPLERYAELPFARPLSLKVGIAPRGAARPFAGPVALRFGERRHPQPDYQHGRGSPPDDPSVHVAPPTIASYKSGSARPAARLRLRPFAGLGLRATRTRTSCCRDSDGARASIGSRPWQSAKSPCSPRCIACCLRQSLRDSRRSASRDSPPTRPCR